MVVNLLEQKQNFHFFHIIVWIIITLLVAGCLFSYFNNIYLIFKNHLENW